ncbi:hypothetical protein HU200_022631 [Digitaria exilis]|uniref:AAA+ ATPase At3g28540-like C-terminal domain-containing protein n=1 Tax=Digitaria exilis TaxID=1010633 RepID=A0A835C524_9POAL|nr:hypothetical protein HU200_022631 [Digitaria exilis]
MCVQGYASLVSNFPIPDFRLRWNSNLRSAIVFTQNIPPPKPTGRRPEFLGRRHAAVREPSTTTCADVPVRCCVTCSCPPTAAPPPATTFVIDRSPSWTWTWTQRVAWRFAWRDAVRSPALFDPRTPRRTPSSPTTAHSPIPSPPPLAPSRAGPPLSLPLKPHPSSIPISSSSPCPTDEPTRPGSKSGHATASAGGGFEGGFGRRAAMALDGAADWEGLGVIGALAYGVLAVAALRRRRTRCGGAWRWADEWAQAYQYYENPLFRKAAAYVSSLPSLEDADAATVVSSGAKSNDFALQLGPGHTATDAFLGARLAWTNAGADRLVLRVRRHDRTRVLRPYLQHVESVADEMEARRRELRLYANTTTAAAAARGAEVGVRALHHTRRRSTPPRPCRPRDLPQGPAYYHPSARLRRSYLLYGAPGTGKSTFAAAMARFLGYTSTTSTCPAAAATTSDLDRYLRGGDGETAAERTARVLSFMDGLSSSSCGEERVFDGVDPAVLRPGRLDVHIHFTMCDFEGFKALASNYLGLKDHKLYPQVEEGFHAGARLSPAELGEIMLANRGSPSRALRTVISALQHVMPSPPPAQQQQQQQRASHRGGAAAEAELEMVRHLDYASAAATSEASTAGQSSPRGGGGFNKDAPIRSSRSSTGLIKYRSRKEAAGVVPVDDNAASPNGGAARPALTRTNR